MTAPRRILLVAACPFPSPQGSQVFVGQMAERLAKAGHEVHLLTYGQGAQQVGRGYRHHRIVRLPGDDASRSGPTLAKPFLDVLLARRVVAITRAQSIEVVHAHNYEAAMAALMARLWTATPVVYHSHNLMGDELETYFDSPAARRIAAAAGEMLDRSVPRRADRTIALCDWSAERLRLAGCNPSALRVIPPAVEDEGPRSVRAEDRAALGIAPSDFVVGYCGNLDRYQNLGLLLRATKRMQREGPSAGALRLLVASHTIPEDFRHEAARADLGDTLRLLEVRGRVEAGRAVAISDVLALPRALGSGYPVKLLNSMSAAKPVVTGGCGAKVLQDEINGVVVADEDPDAMAQALDRCRREPDWRRRLGEAARRTYLESLTWEKVLPQIEDVYAGLREPSDTPVARGANPGGDQSKPSRTDGGRGEKT